jgi:hypothetical protein
MAFFWKKIDVVEAAPIYLDGSDNCYYAREYISNGGFKASETNQLISNFKKPVTARGTGQWQYKEAAIRQFAKELLEVLPDDAIIAQIPSSKCKTDPAYDSRVIDGLRLVMKRKPSIRLVEPIEAVASTQAAHLGGTRNPLTIYNNLRWSGGLPDNANHIIFVDDVITTGAHYKACKRIVLENHTNIQVVGVNWARTVWPSEADPAMSTPLLF